MAAAQLGYRCHIFDPHERPARPTSRPRFTRAGIRRRRRAAALRRRGRCRHLRVRESAGRRRSQALGDKLRPGTRSLADRPGPRGRESASSSRCGARVAPWRDGRQRSTTSRRPSPRSALPLVLKSRRYGYDGKGQAWVRAAGEARGGLGGDRRRSRRSPRPAVDFRGRILGHPRALGRRRRRAPWDPPANSHRDGILRRSTVPAGAPIAAAGGEAPSRRAAHRRGARPCRRADGRIFRQPPTARWSTRSRRASTTAATGRSRAR